jgi:hypothetical protein
MSCCHARVLSALTVRDNVGSMSSPQSARRQYIFKNCFFDKRARREP